MPATLEPTVFGIFGAEGDLTRRKLMPALFNPYLDRKAGQVEHATSVRRGSPGQEVFQWASGTSSLWLVCQT